MKRRCKNPKASDYEYYGGRGISICVRWLKFENFLEDMGDRPEGMTLDRKNTNGNYGPDNCKWATRTEQARSRRNTKLNEVNVERIFDLRRVGNLTQRELADYFDVSQPTIGKVLSERIWCAQTSLRSI